MTDSKHDFLDLHGRQVHAFSSQMANLGLTRMSDLIVAMFESNAWLKFEDGLGTYEFLPGEFDYFLTHQGVDRETVMHGVRDVTVKARLEAAMDERRTGEAGYRRRLVDVRAANPQRPGRPISPFGYTASEAKTLVSEGALPKATSRPPFGSAIRRFTRTGTQRSTSAGSISPIERLRRSAARLDDDDLVLLIEALRQERRRRRLQ